MNEDDPYKEYRLPAQPPVAAPVPAAADPFAEYRTGPPAPAENQSLPAQSAPPDKYRQAAIADREQFIKAGIPLQEGYTRRIGQGAGLGWTDELLAGGETPIQMIRRGTWNPAEGYRYAKAAKDLELEKARENTGALGTVAELAGGLTTGAGVLGSGTRLASTGANYLANIGKAAGFGVIGGAGEAPTVADIPEHAAMGGVLGGTVGAAAPLVIGAGRAAIQPLVGRLRNAEDVGIEHIAKTMRDARVRPQDLTREIADAAAAGQPYTVADVIGKEGQRKLTAMAKTPGEPRDLITETLTNRNLNMPYRISGEVRQGLGAPGTAEAASEALRQQASTQAAPVFERSMQRNTWSERLQDFLDDPIAQQGLRFGVTKQRIENAGTGTPFNPTHAALDAQGNLIAVPNMRTLQTVKTGLDRMIEDAVNPRTGRPTDYGRVLIGFRNRMTNEMGQLNPDYAEANRLYGGPMRIREAVQTGRDMTRSGLPEDTIPAFRRLPADQQQGVRIGYADAPLEQLMRTGNIPSILRAKVPKGVQELEALSLYQGPQRPGQPDQLRRFLNREEEMGRTSTHALGGPATAENLADMGGGPGGLPGAMGMVSSAAHGNPVGFVRNAYETAAHFLKGETEKQRMAITRALLTNDPAAAKNLADSIAAYESRRQGVNPLAIRPPRYAP